MSSAVSSFPSAPGSTKLHAHCCAITRTVRSAGGMFCLTLYQTRTATKSRTMSHTSTAMCGYVIQRFSCFISPVMYWPRTPSFARKRMMKKRKMPSLRRKKKPTIQKISDQMKSMSPAKVDALGTQRSMMLNTNALLEDDEEEHDPDERADTGHRDHEGSLREL